MRPDGIRIRDRGETRDLALRTNAAAATRAPTVAARAPAPARAPSTACALPAGYTGPVYRVNAELLTGIAARPDGWTSLLTPVPGGLAVREGTQAASMLGMKPGDSLVQANGNLVDVCEKCHNEFKPALPTEGIVHAHRHQ